MMNVTYLIETMIVIAQNTSDSTPYTADGEVGTAP
jgi:hypothetical protein